MSKNKLPSDLDGAESVGFMHGTRQKIVKCRAEQYQYTDKLGRPVAGKDREGRPTGKPVPLIPAIVVVFQNAATGEKSRPQKYANGSEKDRVAAKDGSGFELRDGGSAKHALVKGGEAYKFLSSFAPHYPQDKFSVALADYREFEGCVIQVAAMPVGRIAVQANAGDQKTIPVVGEVIEFPWGPNPKYGTAGEDEDEADADEDAEEEAEEPAPKKSAKKGAKSDLSADAREVVLEAIVAKAKLRKYKAGVPVDVVGEVAAELLDGLPNSAKLLKLAQDVDWLEEQASEGAWDYDADEQTLSPASE